MRDRLIEIFHNTNYQNRQNGLTANLATQFTEYALGKVVDALLANGIIVPPCNVGDKVFAVLWSHSLAKKVVKPYIVDELFYSTKRGIRPWVVICFGGQRFDNIDFGKTVFLTKEEAEKALAERREG